MEDPQLNTNAPQATMQSRHNRNIPRLPKDPKSSSSDRWNERNHHYQDTANSILRARLITTNSEQPHTMEVWSTPVASASYVKRTRSVRFADDAVLCTFQEAPQEHQILDHHALWWDELELSPQKKTTTTSRTTVTATGRWGDSYPATTTGSTTLSSGARHNNNTETETQEDLPQPQEAPVLDHLFMPSLEDGGEGSDDDDSDPYQGEQQEEDEREREPSYQNQRSVSLKPRFALRHSIPQDNKEEIIMTTMRMILHPAAGATTATAFHNGSIVVGDPYGATSLGPTSTHVPASPLLSPRSVVAKSA